MSFVLIIYLYYISIINIMHAFIYSNTGESCDYASKVIHSESG